LKKGQNGQRDKKVLREGVAKRLGQEIEALLRMGCVAPFFWAGKKKFHLVTKKKSSATHDFCEENATKVSNQISRIFKIFFFVP